MITVHVANPGAMLWIVHAGSRVFGSSKSDNPSRKLSHSWELVEADLGLGLELVGVNMGASQSIGRRRAGGGPHPELSGYDTIRREVKYGISSRCHFLLESATAAILLCRILNVHK